MLVCSRGPLPDQSDDLFWGPPGDAMSPDLPAWPPSYPPAQNDGVDAPPPAHGSRPEAPPRRATEHDRRHATQVLEAKGMHDIHLIAGSTYYGQGEGNWKNHPYPKSPPEAGQRLLQKAGCAPTALAMADATLRGSSTTPPEVADFAVANGHSGKRGQQGSDTAGLIKRWGRDHGLHVEKMRSLDELRDRVTQGGVAVISVGKGHFTESGHVMVVNGHARDQHGREWFFIANPGQQWPRSTPDGQVVVEPNLHHGAGKVRVSREVLENELKYGFVMTRMVQS